jgi:putative methionine-R-sulfoxide reductase with GAF domain
MHDLAKRDGVTVLLVTHDNRILDVADRIIHLEDGRLSSFATAVARESRRLMDTLAQHNRKGDLAQHVRGLSMDEFGQVLADATAECEEFLRVTELGNTEAFDSMLEQTLEAITLKIGDILAADRVSLFLVDEAQRELFSKVAQGADGRPLEIRVPFGAGIVGRVVETGEAMNVPDAYAEPLFNRRVDEATGYRTRSILCVPLRTRQGRVFAVVQVLNRRDGDPFDGRDEHRLREFSTPLGLVLESWGRMARREQPRQAEPSP